MNYGRRVSQRDIHYFGEIATHLIQYVPHQPACIDQWSQDKEPP